MLHFEFMSRCLSQVLNPRFNISNGEKNSRFFFCQFDIVYVS